MATAGEDSVGAWLLEMSKGEPTGSMLAAIAGGVASAAATATVSGAWR
jgi:hypothetical protein